MEHSLRLIYELTAGDVEAGVEILVRPTAGAECVRPALIRLVWSLLALALAMMIYLEASFWTRLARLGAPMRAAPAWCLAVLFVLPPLWCALCAASWWVTRHPDGAMRWMRARLTRKLLASRAPGLRTLTLTPAGVEIAAGEEKMFRAWPDVRRARGGESHLVLDASDLWFIVPLHALAPADRASLLVEVGARLPIAAP